MAKKQVVELKINKPVQWNKDLKCYCKDLVPLVKPVGYMTVFDLIGTSGCSKEEPYWNYTVMGVVETDKGKTLVSPGDWIIKTTFGQIMVVDNKTYEKHFK